MELILFFSVLTLFFGSSFFYLKIKRPQTIWLGFTFLGFLFSFILCISIYLLQHDFRIPLVILAITFVIFSISAPTLIMGTFLVNGVKLIRNEGFKFSNLLTLVLGVALIIYIFFWPIIVDITQSHILNTVYQWIIFTTAYLSFIFIFYAFTNLLNLIHIKKQKIDYFIVLGAGLNGKKVTPLLAGRINKGIDVRNLQNSGKIVFSGGQGPDELVPEGEAMAQYALQQGVPDEIILKETESISTYQNIKFSKEIIDEDWPNDSEPKIAIVTNNYHVLRGLMQARDLGINCIGYGSRSKFYFSLNAFIREFVAYLQMTYKMHGTVIALSGIFLFALDLFLELNS